jgi:PKD domain
MRRTLIALVVVAGALVLAAAGQATVTKDFTFKSKGTAATPGAVAGIGAAGTYEDIPFTIASGDSDGTVSVTLNWTNQLDDWDLYVYRKDSSGNLQPVGSSAGGPPSTSENAVIQSQDGPVTPGNYVIRAQNYAATSSSFTGSVKFTAYVPPNVPPVASFKAPSTARSGQTITLDASGSHDPDGNIVDFAWDLDGDGAMDVSSGTTPTLKHAFSAGTHYLTVRVTDNRGARAYANATVNVR